MTTPDFTTDADTAADLDLADPLAPMRSEFHLPRGVDGGSQIYFDGHSLGAVPITAADYVAAEMDRWARLGVAGHFDGDEDWISYHELLADQLASIVGGHVDEVVAMNSLTVNLHLLMVSFYTPTARRHKVLIEEHAFPSDHYAVESQIRQRGFDPARSLIVLGPRPGEETLRGEDILSAIADHGDELALVLLPGLQYYTGQVLPMADITRRGHEVGANVGFDLAHAAGNVILDLHEWDVDFAAWCSYKYLNGGPGSIGAAFVHQRHLSNQTLPKFHGWWGGNKDARFEMSTVFDPTPTVESWQISNSPILAMAPLRASLDLFDRAGGMGALRAKSEQQLAYFDFLLEAVLRARVRSITPRDFDERGCQQSLRITDPSVDGLSVYQQLIDADVACDWRYPDVIRVAPVPLYNSFTDIHRFVNTLDVILDG